MASRSPASRRSSRARSIRSRRPSGRPPRHSPGEQAGAHIAVAPEDVQQIPVFRPAVLYVIEQVQKRGEYRSVPFFQQALHLADELRAEVFHQIAEQFLFVCEIHVKAAPGNPRPMDDPVDRGLGKGGPDKFGPRRRQEFFPLGRRQIEKCGAGHRASLPAVP